MEEIKENWSVWLPILISSLAFVVSLLSYLNSKRGRIISNQPMLEINRIFDESLNSAGYLTISIHNLNDKPIQIINVEVPKENFKFEVDHGQFSVQKANREYTTPKRNSMLVYLYVDKNQSLNKELILTYRDFENKKRKLKSEKLLIEDGKVTKGLSGSKFIII
ncbi:hypothetical protein ACFPFV_09325 [Salinicoccus siamensis]|uniref:Uncharacterized protein n=1 Tax=Salinicoccus siamensis TaxID=381830 RepID=A0ABV5Z4L3_9STAP